MKECPFAKQILYLKAKDFYELYNTKRKMNYWTFSSTLKMPISNGNCLRLDKK